jgi:FkbM family methyltransferase
LGVLGGVTLGGGVGFFSGRQSVASPASLRGTKQSYAQQGEDIIVAQMFMGPVKVTRPSYIDIGAHDPIADNNTYLLYRHGCRGVLVEPNPVYAKKLRATRPEDIVIEAGIGPDLEDTLADYFILKGDGQLNTFSKDQVDEIVAKYGPNVVAGVTKVRLINVNKVMAEHFPKGGPDFVSVDTEGLDLDILRSLDTSRFRPKIVCAETLEVDGGASEEIPELMAARGYSARGATYVNTIFVDDVVLPRRKSKSAPPRSL